MAAVAASTWAPVSERAPVPIEPQAQPKTFFNTCVEQIDLSKDIANKYQHMATMRKTQGIIFLALSSAAIIASFVLVGLYFPIYIPIAGVVLGILTTKVADVYKNNFGFSAKQFEMLAKQTRDIAQEYKNIQEADRLQTYIDILTLAPHTSYDQMEKAQYLLAHCKYWEKEFSVNDRAMRVHVEKAKATEEPGLIVSHYAEASQFRKAALEAKACAAIFAAVMQKPDFIGEANDICTFRDFTLPLKTTYNDDQNLEPAGRYDRLSGSVIDTWAKRAIYREFGDTRADAFVVFKNREIAPLTMQEVENLSQDAITTRLVAAMPSA